MSPSPDHPSDELAAYALGTPIEPSAQQHIQDCPRCQEDLTAYRAIADLARHGGELDTAARPPEHVWARITDDLGWDVASPAPAATGAAPTDRPRDITEVATRRRLRRWVSTGLVAAAAVLAAGIGGWLLGERHSQAPRMSAQAELAAQPGTTAAAHGRATMLPAADGFQMQLTTSGLPAPAGYYEVWLYDPSAGKMVAIGTLGTDAKGTFTVPAGIDTHAYHVVDVSNQRYNGDPAHQTSVLRGTLSPG